jgi:murein DD-endopeptidase MepM/ murein hydrolase activator NlpD
MRQSNNARVVLLELGRWDILAHLYRLGLVICLVLICVEVLSKPARAGPRGSLRLPVSCILGTECFVQQMPDIDPSAGVLDPFCGQATYQGHDGWDIRLRSLRDIAQDVAVLAVAGGRVTRTRDGIDDQIYDDAEDKTRVADKECGNGVLIEHENGLNSQYCHLRNGSLLVKPGAQVQKGQRIGAIGSSGLAQFPHVHLSIRLDGKLVEPLTGRPLGNANLACGDFSVGLFEQSAVRALGRPSAAIVEYGLADAVPNLPDLVRNGAPPPAKNGVNPTVAWLWAINVEEGYRLRIKLVGSDETTLIDHTTNALAKRKANYLAYVGWKSAISSGKYRLSVEILNGDKSIQSTDGLFIVPF